MVARLVPRAPVLIAAWTGFMAITAMGHATATHACEARVRIVPPHPYVGQQVLHEIEWSGVERTSRIEWLAPPVFPDLRAVTLPPAPPDPRADPNARRSRRALWPGLAGDLRIAEATYHCQTVEGDAGEFRTPATVLGVRAVPDAGRPASWRGLVGVTHLNVEASAQTIRVGESLALRAVASGPGHLRRARIEWPRAELEGQSVAPELFEQPIRMHERLGDVVIGRVVAVLDVVPHEPGRLHVPPLRVAFFDPDRGTFAETRSEAFSIEVRPERTGPENPSSQSGGDRDGMREADVGVGVGVGVGGNGRWWGGALACLVGLAGAFAWLRSRRPRD